MSVDEFLDAYLFTSRPGPYSATDAQVAARAVEVLRKLAVSDPDALRAALEIAAAEPVHPFG